MKNIFTEQGVNLMLECDGVIDSHLVNLDGKDVFVIQLSDANEPDFDMVRAENSASGWWSVCYFNTSEGHKVSEFLREEELSRILQKAMGLGFVGSALVH